MIRFSTLLISLVMLMSSPALAELSGRVQGAQIFLNQGNPEQAIQTAEKLLASPSLTEDERFALLKLVVDAEEFRTDAAHYQDITRALAAIDTLRKEFPDTADHASLLWRAAWLHWKAGSDKLAMAAAREITERYYDSPHTTNAWLLMGRIHVSQNRLNLARNDLVQHGIEVRDGSPEQETGRAWIAVIDFEEGRFEPAFNALVQVYEEFPSIIESNERLNATYIQLLNRKGEVEQAIQKSDKFLKQYVKGRYIPEVRLLRADMLLQQGKMAPKLVQKEYEKIAIAAAETSVGKKAFMRKMMLQYRDSNDYSNLKPVIIALKRIASQNQLSDVESESILYQARLWVRVAEADPEHAPKQSITAALEDYARVVVSPYPNLVSLAREEGVKTFSNHLESLVGSEKWMQAVVVWERFPQLRPENRSAAQLRLDVAHALRMLMQYEQSEAILNELYEQAAGSVWGHKVKLEQVRLWLDRGDKDGFKRVMRWLSRNEFTLYRPEMLLLAARMQLKDGNASAASQTIASVAPEDVAVEERGTYWMTQARIAEALSRWHVAAHAWRQYEESEGSDGTMALMEQANAMFKAKEYAKAELLYADVPEDLREAEWRYRYSICQMKSGKWRQAIERLEALKVDSQAGIYASLAALALAERQADILMEAHP